MAKPAQSKISRPLAFGLAATLVVLLLQITGSLSDAQGWAYDERVKRFQFFTPKPDDSLVHLHIDDAALGIIGGWPWPRSYMGRIVDELALAQPKAVAFDFLFIEAQSHKAIGAENQNQTLTLTGQDEDQKFADAIGKAGNVILPVRFDVRPLDSARERASAAMVDNLEITRQDLEKKLRLAGDQEAAKWAAEPGHFRQALEDALTHRIDREISKLAPGLFLTLKDWRRRLLPGDDLRFRSNERVWLIERIIPKVRAAQETYKFTLPESRAKTAVMIAEDINPPIYVLAEQISGTGFVNAFYEAGVLRNQPLLINYNNRLYPQLGLALAMKMLDAPIGALVISDQEILIDSPTHPKVIPVRQRWSKNLNQQVGTLMDIPWFGDHGPGGWVSLYKGTTPDDDRQRSILNIWDVVLKQENLRKNLRELDFAVAGLLRIVDTTAFQAYAANPFPKDETQARFAAADAALAKALDPEGFFLEYAKLTDAQIDELTADEADAAKRDRDRNDLKFFRAACTGIPTLKSEIALEVKAIADAREKLHAHFSGKAVIVGWVATGALADIVQTSLHPTMPGVMAHGVIYNAIMGGEMWRQAPEWINDLVTLLMGLAITLICVRLSPVPTVICAFGLIAAYVIFNGLVLFDYGNVIVEVAGPVVVGLLVWAGATLIKIVEEITERRRITKRFQNYVDPALVQYVIDHPDEVRLEGQVREMTVVFTDLAGFTTLSEKLKEKTVDILNEYIDMTVPIIESQNGLVNKFLGDGIMFFYNSPPRPMEGHALAAITTVVKLQEALVTFNESLKRRGLPTVKMRAGIASGQMIVGDAGGKGRSDFTVLGDTVNLSARLESANKATSTLMMANQRTFELIPDNQVLFRPIAKLQVVGKTESVMVYEPITTMDRANNAQLKFVELTTLMVDSFIRGNFEECITNAKNLERLAGGDKLTITYITLCEKYLKEGPPLNFDGQIVLLEK